MTADIHQHVAGLLAAQPLAVLCTRGQRVHASLIAIAPADDLRHIFFATPRTTEKFTNLAADPDAALLVHNADGGPDDFQQAMAVTIAGSARETGAGEIASFDRIFLARHPTLAPFLAAPSTARMTFTVEAYRLVRHFQQVTVYRVT
ncbi:MAG: pyridoxamine 5'-phosphate oxidase family protein [Candidatus Competibacteraceae bacterium]